MLKLNTKLNREKKVGFVISRALAFVLVAGGPVVVASVPHSKSGSSDVAIYQNLHEIKITKTKYIDFDGDIVKLSAQEKSHRSALPNRISVPAERVSHTPYQPSPKRRVR